MGGRAANKMEFTALIGLLCKCQGCDRKDLSWGHWLGKLENLDKPQVPLKSLVWQKQPPFP